MFVLIKDVSAKRMFRVGPFTRQKDADEHVTLVESLKFDLKAWVDCKEPA